jgi:MFS family permease
LVFQTPPSSKKWDANPCAGLAESTFYPGMQYLIGSYYRKDELAKRSCIFHVSSALGSMFSGYLMAAVFHLDGTGGFAGWQWYDPSPAANVDGQTDVL